MKVHIRIALSVMLACVGTAAGYQNVVDPPYEVGTWQGFCSAATSYTFDDYCPNQPSIAIPMFNEFGFKMTLFTITGTTFGWPADWNVLAGAAAQGHEIASHTISHGYLNQISDSLQTVELRDSRDYINAHIPGNQCLTLAYPYCVTGKNSICAQYYIAARTCSGSIVNNSPGDFLNISSIIVGDQGSIRTTQDFITQGAAAVKAKGWMVFLLHGIDNDGGYSPLSSTVLRESLEYFRDNSNQFWVATFSEVTRYIKERNAVSVTELSQTENTLTVQVTDTLDNAVFSVPVTIRRPLPEGWASAEVTQNGQPVETIVAEIDSVITATFDAVPDGGDVVISKAAANAVENRTGLG